MVKRKHPSASDGASHPALSAKVAKQKIMARYSEDWMDYRSTPASYLRIQNMTGRTGYGSDELAQRARGQDVDSLAQHAHPFSEDRDGDGQCSMYDGVFKESALLESRPEQRLAPDLPPEGSFLSLQNSISRPNPKDAVSSDEIGAANEIPRSALPGLNMAINMATLTPYERDLFVSLAPDGLQDPHTLMNTVLVSDRDEMMMHTARGGSHHNLRDECDRAGEERGDPELDWQQWTTLEDDFDGFLDFSPKGEA